MQSCLYQEEIQLEYLRLHQLDLMLFLEAAFNAYLIDLYTAVGTWILYMLHDSFLLASDVSLGHCPVL